MGEVAPAAAGAILRSQRDTLGMTLQKLAGEVGISIGHLAGVEKGERVPSVHLLNRLADRLKLSKEDRLELFAGFGILPEPFGDFVKQNVPLVVRLLKPHLRKHK